MDSTGALHLAYGGEHLEHAVLSGGTWQFQEIAVHGTYCSLALDSSDFPVVSYADGDAGDVLALARWNGGAWNIEVVGSGTSTGFSSLAFSSSGNPAVMFCADWGPTLAQWNGSTWEFSSFEWLVTGWCGGVSLAFDSSDSAVFVYGDIDNQQRLYMYSLHSGTIEWEGNLLLEHHPAEPSLSYSPSGYPGISYAWSASGLLFANPVQSIQGEGIDSGCSPSLVFDSSSCPTIAYYNADDGALKFARVSPDSILRGDSPLSVPEVTRRCLPWTDPELVMTPSFPPLLFYRVEGTDRIYLRKEAQTITVFAG
jgi:hypothetical protein